jgi:tetratricopeptide (TPR) repeat protein
VNKAQWIIIGVGVLLVAGLYRYGRKAPKPSEIKAPVQSTVQNELTSDSILLHAKEILKPGQLNWMNSLEQSVIRGDVKTQKLNVYHQLAHFWKDSIGIFEPYIWYEAEAARLENSEKSLTFAAHLLLGNLRREKNDRLKRWKALQAKDLFERSLKINNKNDSTIVGLSAARIFGDIADNPMEEIGKLAQVVRNDSTNVFALTVLGDGAVITRQYDAAIKRFEKVVTLQPGNLEAILKLAEIYERKADTVNAIKWYSNALPLVGNSPNPKAALEKRIEELSVRTPVEKK